MSDTPNETISDLALAANAIFNGGANSFAMDNGKVVEIRPAKMKQMTDVMGFFKALVSRLEPGQLGRIIEFIAKRQREAMAAGKKPTDIDLMTLLREMVDRNGDDAQGIEGEEMVVRGIETSSLFFDMLGAVLEEMPRLIPSFTNLTVAEFEEMDLAEATAVIGGIFMVNYRFFTQSLRPILLAFGVGVMRKHLESIKSQTPISSKTTNATSGRKQQGGNGRNKTAS